MRGDKEQTVKLRKLGKSYSEIKTLLGVPKSTLSEWLAKSDWSSEIKMRLAQRASLKGAVGLRALDTIRGIHLVKMYEEARREAREEFEYLKLYPLFVAGIAIYWGEGEKASRHIVRMGNTDPLMIQSFMRFLLDICGLPLRKIRGSILLYPDLDQKECEDFWAKQSGLPRENFQKSIIIQGRHKTRRLKYGVCTIVVSSTYLKEKMRVWLELLPTELTSADHYPRE